MSSSRGPEVAATPDGPVHSATCSASQHLPMLLTCILEPSKSSSSSLSDILRADEGLDDDRVISDENPDANPTSSSISSLPLRQDPDKKSVFWVDPPSSENSSDPHCYIMANPAECLLTRASTTSTIYSRDQVFYFGGFQLWSSGNKVEVYCRDGQNTASQQDADCCYYLTTVQGLKQPQPQSALSKEQYKAMCVVPGGPRPVTMVKLILLSTTTKSTTATSQVRLDKIRWTLRVPPTREPQEHASPQEGTPVEKEKTESLPDALPWLSPPAAEVVHGPRMAQHPPATPQQSSLHDPNDTIGAMMAGLSFAIRQSEERIVQRVQEETGTLKEQLAQAQQQIQFLTMQVQSLVNSQQQQQLDFAKLLQQENASLHQKQLEILTELRNLREKEANLGLVERQVLPGMNGNASLVDADDDDGPRADDSVQSTSTDPKSSG